MPPSKPASRPPPLRGQDDSHSGKVARPRAGGRGRPVAQQAPHGGPPSDAGGPLRCPRRRRGRIRRQRSGDDGDG
eukprot:5858100-Alexandrium_andersonii.AAC.1